MMKKSVTDNKRKMCERFSKIEKCKIAKTKEDISFSLNTGIQTRKISDSEVSDASPTKIHNFSVSDRQLIVSSLSESECFKRAKRVSFDNSANKLIVYDIDPGNTMKKCPTKDVPLVIKKAKKHNYPNREKICPRLEKYLLNICCWNPNWLKNEGQSDKLSLIVGDKKLAHAFLKYETYEDYCNIMEPLLILELWHSLTSHFNIGAKNLSNVIMSSIVNKNSIVVATVPSPKINVTTLMLEVVVSKKDIELQSYPVHGDLVSFEYTSSNETGKPSTFQVFAYVMSIRQTIITPSTHFNRDLINFVEEPYVVLTYTMMTKSLDQTSIQKNRMLKLQKISHIYSNIRMLKGLQYLSVSPLLNQILHPNIDDYQLPLVKNFQTHHLVTKDKLSFKQSQTVARITNTVVQQIPKICLVEGPPGTGKTKVIVNLIVEILYGNGRYQHEQPLRILVCSSSNASIDEIVLRLLKVRKIISESDRENRFKMIRLGESAMMHSLVRKVALTELARSAVKKTIARYLSRLTDDNIEEEIHLLQARINTLELELLSAQNASLPDPKRIVRKLNDAKAKFDLLMSRRSAKGFDSLELVSLQKSTEDSLLAGADVIACTLESCYNNQMESVFTENNEAISVCIIDEATRSAEVETLVPLMLGVKTLVLFGDTNQIPESIKSQRARQFGLNKSVFSRVKKIFMGQDKNPIIQLDTQYRMSFPVSSWPNRYFYAGGIKNAANLHRLSISPYKVIDIDFTKKNDKLSCIEEAIFIANLVYTLMSCLNIKNDNFPPSLGIITTCESHKVLITEKIAERIGSLSINVKKRILHEVNTIEGFQGQERHVIIIACGCNRHFGFLSDPHKLSLALTRAKHSLILCGNFEYFRGESMCNSLLMDARFRRVYVKMKATASPEEIKPYVVR